jgi:hypothetical protein
MGDVAALLEEGDSDFDEWLDEDEKQTASAQT